ncbi:hypothetical protein BDV96DRAFT_147664 [Lophiotrema nucula]|uniref:Uncharacterized protein n=1 Tax=Lophiotrema nucula TaxID=690887 RepID=A0A6A5Z0P1_9PLEO|nr:hypothetical protein BDV96DRAFT_147664 [Lophiotrema nucula]
MVIHGFDCTNWAAYAFVDCDAPLPLVDDEADENDALLQFVPPIAPHTSLEELRPEASLWDPRDYFLRVVACRMTLVLREWTHLVRKVKRAADNYRAENSELLERNYQAPPTSITSSFYRIVRMIELLQDLRYCFARLMLVWKRFSDSNGDVRYFDDLESRKAREALDNIDKTFEELEALEQTLLHLVNTCEKWYKTLELRMCFESNRLCFESNRVNLKSASSQPMAHKLNQKSHQLNMETSRISLETNKVALANHVVTRYANSMNQMLIPLIVVVLYLGPQKEVFELDRNLRAFILSFFLILVGVQLWIYLSRFLYRKLHQTEWWTKIGRWPLLSYVLRFVIMNELGQVESALPTTSTFEVCIAMEHRRKDTDPLRV